MIWVLGSALAWSSLCFTDEPGDDFNREWRLCSDGYEKARYPLRTEHPEKYHKDLDRPEHATIWDTAFVFSGLPEGLQEEFTLRHYTDGSKVVLDTFTMEPVVEDPQYIAEREVTVGGMAQLPDMSYTLWDWALGNEYCPVNEQLNPTSCHTFSKHMGAYNSNHFVPQSRYFYAWYHQLALDRAAECKALHQLTGGDVNHEATVMACEKEAMLLEAIGHHFLQDAWSSGHMWERWGSYKAEDMDGLGRSILIAMLAGTWHGSKAVMDDTEKTAEYAPWDDPMCAPAPDGAVIEYVDPKDGQRHPAVGDIFWKDRAYTEVEYQPQRDALMGCSVVGMREVYKATAQVHGSMEDALSDYADLERDPTGDSCWEQRVTNQSLLLGSQVHHGEAPDQETMEDSSGLPWYMNMAGRALDLMLTTTAQVNFKGDDEVDFGWLGPYRFRRDAGKARYILTQQTKNDPNGTGSARGLNSIDGIATNSRFVQDLTLGEKPATWVDPALPWQPDASDQTQALTLVFGEAHAADRCEWFTEDQLMGMQLTAYDEVGNEEVQLARASMCAEYVRPHLRVGVDEISYNSLQEPLCGYVGGTILYSGHANYATVDLDEAVASWCEGELLRDGGFEGDPDATAWEFAGNAEITPGVYSITPHSGEQMLDLLYLTTSPAAYSDAFQRLSIDTLQGTWVLRFSWMAFLNSDYYYSCPSPTPYFAVYLSSAREIPTYREIFSESIEDWCEELHIWDGGSAYAVTDWVQEEIVFDGEDTTEPWLEFTAGTNRPRTMHLLVDDISLERP